MLIGVILTWVNHRLGGVHLAVFSIQCSRLVDDCLSFLSFFGHCFVCSASDYPYGGLTFLDTLRVILIAGGSNIKWEKQIVFTFNWQGIDFHLKFHWNYRLLSFGIFSKFFGYFTVAVYLNWIYVTGLSTFVFLLF